MSPKQIIGGTCPPCTPVSARMAVVRTNNKLCGPESRLDTALQYVYCSDILYTCTTLIVQRVLSRTSRAVERRSLCCIKMDSSSGTQTSSVNTQTAAFT